MLYFRSVIIGHICKLNFSLCAAACGQMSERKMQPSPWPLREVLMEKSVLTQERNHKLNVPQTPVSPAAFSWAIRAPGFNSQHSFQRQTGAKLWHQGRIFQARCSQNCDHQESCLELLGQDYSTLTHDKTQLNSLCFILLAVPKYNVRNSHSPALGTADFWGLFDLKFFVLQVYKHQMLHQGWSDFLAEGFS